MDLKEAESELCLFRDTNGSDWLKLTYNGLIRAYLKIRPVVWEIDT